MDSVSDSISSWVRIGLSVIVAYTVKIEKTRVGTNAKVIKSRLKWHPIQILGVAPPDACSFSWRGGEDYNSARAVLRQEGSDMATFMYEPLQ